MAAQPVPPGERLVGRAAERTALSGALERPGLAVIAGPPGSGKSALARSVTLQRSSYVGGGLVTLRQLPGLPLRQAVRAPIPTDDRALAVEAVRARVGDGVLVLEDLQWVDAFTLALLPRLSRHLRVLTTIRLPAPLLGDGVGALRAAATCWRDLRPLDDGDATTLIRRIAPGLPGLTVQTLAGRADGNPLLLTLLARSPDGAPTRGLDAVAALIAELPQPERTAAAALGLLGRPADVQLLGPGGPALVRRGLAVRTGRGEIASTDSWLAEVAAGLLPARLRADMHRRIAALVGDAEAAQHLAAAGETTGAALLAERAAGAADGVDHRAALLHLAAQTAPNASRCRIAAHAALRAGRPERARQLLATMSRDAAGAAGTDSERVEDALLAAAAARACGGHDAARDLLTAALPMPAGVSPDLRAEHAAELIRATVPADPSIACVRAADALAGTSDPPAALLLAVAEARIAAREPDWEGPLWTAIEQLRATGGRAAAAPAELAFVRGLREELRTAEAARAADDAAAACPGAYSWETAFRAESLWSRLLCDGAVEDALREATALLDHELPPPTADLLRCTLALAHADGGSTAEARRVAAAVPTRLARWVMADTAWLDGDQRAGAADATMLLTAAAPRRDLAAMLAALTAAWSGQPPPAAPWWPMPVRCTVTAASQSGRWEAAAAQWCAVAVREQIRCLIAVDEEPALLGAEALAAGHGLTALLGRARRALRRHGVTRNPVASAAGALTAREAEVLALVAAGQSSRRIATRLGVSVTTIETHVKSAMAKLGAHTRTEAAVLAAPGAA